MAAEDLVLVNGNLMDGSSTSLTVDGVSQIFTEASYDEELTPGEVEAAPIQQLLATTPGK